ncbi:MAG TPA: hypothetical protein VN851_17840 [Thermoanaerobaculia bacterium]|nr:hypothetical protein [Thermoanaerobaculia bacterium]
MKPASLKSAPGADLADQLAGFIAKFEPEVGRLVEACRAEVRKLLPTTFELVYDNYNFLAIGYSTTERASDCIVSIAAAANGVGLSFYYGATLPDPEGLLLGGGKQNRFIRLPSTEPFRSPGVLALIQAAIAQADPPPLEKGGGTTIIKSISVKQKPRRKA